MDRLALATGPGGGGAVIEAPHIQQAAFIVAGISHNNNRQDSQDFSGLIGFFSSSRFHGPPWKPEKIITGTPKNTMCPTELQSGA